MAIDSTELGKSGPNQTVGDDAQLRSKGSELAGWIMGRVNRWRSVRNANYLRSWDDYYQIWRGVWSPQQQTREVERSRLIAPATQQAVDSTIAEMTEATFGRGVWFDVDEDDDKKRQQAALCQENLLEDFARDHLKHAIIETYSSGCIYGTGIAKRIVEETTQTKIKSDKFAGVSEDSSDVKKVYWESIPPFNFVIDTVAKTVDEALGAAHETVRPYHEIKMKQASGEYYKGTIGTMSGYNMALVLRGPRGESLEIDPEDGVYITEYHGFVPREMLEDASKDEVEDSPLAGLEMDESEPADQTESDEDDYVEAIVTIANGGTLLKAVKNPFGGDRGFVAYPHDKVPNKFWGRGVCEKAWNSQKALDAQLRARIDALALMTYPIVAADATRLPRNLNLQITPGKTILTNGNPGEVIQPLSFGNMDPASFQQSGDLERMVQMATGAMDSATPTNINARNETAAGASMMSGAVVKRAKLTMQNVDSYFLQPMIVKTLTAYRVIDPERYPYEVEFTVNTTMSIMAREYEQTQMTNLLAILPPESPPFLMVLKAIAENYSGPSKDKLVSSIEQMMQPNPEQQKQQQQMQQLQQQLLQGEVAELHAKVQKMGAEMKKIEATAMKEVTLAHSEHDKIAIDQMNSATAAHQAILKGRELQIQEAEMHLNHIKDIHQTLTDAESEQRGQALEHHHKTLEHKRGVAELAMEHTHHQDEMEMENRKLAVDKIKAKNAGKTKPKP